MCLKDAAQWSCGYCPYGKPPPPDKSLITRVKRAKHWGFCSDLCNIEGYTNTLKETQLTVLPVKDGAVFNPGCAGDGELCAGKKIEYPKMKVYIGKEKNGKYYYEQKKSKTNYVNTQLLFQKMG